MITVIPLALQGPLQGRLIEEPKHAASAGAAAVAVLGKLSCAMSKVEFIMSHTDQTKWLQLIR